MLKMKIELGNCLFLAIQIRKSIQFVEELLQTPDASMRVDRCVFTPHWPWIFHKKNTTNLFQIKNHSLIMEQTLVRVSFSNAYIFRPKKNRKPSATTIERMRTRLF